MSAQAELFTPNHLRHLTEEGGRVPMKRNRRNKYDDGVSTGRPAKQNKR